MRARKITLAIHRRNLHWQDLYYLWLGYVDLTAIPGVLPHVRTCGQQELDIGPARVREGLGTRRKASDRS